jgi:hypothetical protein
MREKKPWDLWNKDQIIYEREKNHEIYVIRNK